MPFEGGFQGRTNKLVDACYSWWQGGLFPLLDLALNRSKSSKEEQEDEDGDYLYIQKDLQHYLLACCQDKGGGLKDKPEKSKDFYHTCYALSGLSSSQHNRPSHSPTLVGNPKNLLVKNLTCSFLIVDVNSSDSQHSTRKSCKCFSILFGNVSSCSLQVIQYIQRHSFFLFPYRSSLSFLSSLSRMLKQSPHSKLDHLNLFFYSIP